MTRDTRVWRAVLIDPLGVELMGILRRPHWRSGGLSARVWRFRDAPKRCRNGG